MSQTYDQIGEGYTKHRCADLRVVAQLIDFKLIISLSLSLLEFLHAETPNPVR
jgi:hypothetical protein